MTGSSGFAHPNDIQPTQRVVRIITRLCDPCRGSSALGFGCLSSFPTQRLPTQVGPWVRAGEDGAQRRDAAHRRLVAELLPFARHDGDGGGGGGGV